MFALLFTTSHKLSLFLGSHVLSRSSVPLLVFFHMVSSNLAQILSPDHPLRQLLEYRGPSKNEQSRCWMKVEEAKGVLSTVTTI
jgi:hypothetical protein